MIPSSDGLVVNILTDIFFVILILTFLAAIGIGTRNVLSNEL
jgi:hypothetical protein